MNIKSLALAGLLGSTLLLTGCGGGDAKPTVIDGFDMAQGAVDTKKGATYLQEFLTAQNARVTTVGDLYSRLNIPGVEQAHKDGWTGKGTTVTILDNQFNQADGHGRNVSDIVHTTAPGAARNEYALVMNSDESLRALASDVITTSVGFLPSDLIANPGLVLLEASLIRAAEGSNALVTIAAQHNNWIGGTKAQLTTCPNPANATMTVENCNTWALKGLDSNNVIYVGEIDSNNTIPSWSNQAGDVHKNQFITTSSNKVNSQGVDGNPNGNSFAAPRVAGAGALVRHKFPNLSGSQTATVILHTADDLGVAGVDSVYGHGRLNVGAALAPVGNLH